MSRENFPNLRVSVDTKRADDRRVVKKDASSIKGPIVCEMRGALPYCQCKDCESCKTRNLAILAPTLRHKPYTRSGRPVPPFYRMGFGELREGAPLLHSLDQDRFTTEMNIGPGRFDGELIDPCVGTQESNVNLFRFKIGIYNFLLRYYAPLSAVVWALLSTTFERSAAEIYELVQALWPGVARLARLEDVETALNDILVPLALAVVPEHASETNGSPEEVPASFKAFAEKNLDGGNEIVSDFAEQTLCQIRQARMVRAYRAEARGAGFTKRGDRELEEVRLTYGIKFRDQVFKYLAHLMTVAWEEVRDSDVLKVPIFLPQSAIDTMLDDLLNGAPDKAVPKYRLSIVNKPVLSTKKRLSVALEQGEVPPQPDKRQRREEDKDVADPGRLRLPEEDEEEEEY